MREISRKIFNNEMGLEAKIQDTEEYKKRQQDYREAYEALETTLNEEQKKMLDHLWLCSGGVQGELLYMYYSKGFREGLLFGLEICEAENT